MKLILPLLVMLFCLSCKKDEVDNGNGYSEIFKVVEDMPAFPGCEDISNKAEKKACSDERLLSFIDENLEYPAAAKAAGIEGLVVIKFIIEIDGSIGGEQIVRDIGYGCGNEALRVISKMPIWEPGKQRGVPVRVQYNLPFNFEF